MIIIDSRVGSKELAKLFPSTTPTTVLQLEFGDFAFAGNGKEGAILVGIERKTITDLLDCIRSGRLTGHQIPGLMENYGKIYLIVEGRWKSNNGILEQHVRGQWQEIPRNTIRYNQLVSFIASCEEFAGIRFIYTPSPESTAQAVEALYWYWQKPYESHSSHLKLKSVDVELSPLVRPTMLVKILAQLPGIGAKKARAASKHFRSVYEIATSMPEDWMKIAGIGKTMAEKIVKSIREEQK